jgi:hypothetical protein
MQRLRADRVGQTDHVLPRPRKIALLHHRADNDEQIEIEEYRSNALYTCACDENAFLAVRDRAYLFAREAFRVTHASTSTTSRIATVAARSSRRPDAECARIETR